MDRRGKGKGRIVHKHVGLVLRRQNKTVGGGNTDPAHKGKRLLASLLDIRWASSKHRAWSTGESFSGMWGGIKSVAAKLLAAFSRVLNKVLIFFVLPPALQLQISAAQGRRSCFPLLWPFTVWPSDWNRRLWHSAVITVFSRGEMSALQVVVMGCPSSNTVTAGCQATAVVVLWQVVDSLFFWKIKIGFRYFFSQGSNYRQSSVVQLCRILPML